MLSVRLAPVLAGLLLLAAGVYTRSGLAQSARPSALPSPEKFFGFQMGADRKLADWDKLHEYYQLLAKSSNRMKLVELGKTSEGRPFIALFISSPANLAKLEQFRQINAQARRSARAARGRGAGSSSPRQGGRSCRAFALHSTEVAAVADRRRVRLRQPDRAPTRRRSGSSTTSSASWCRRSIPTARRWSPTGT